jgi:hypothetical protein
MADTRDTALSAHLAFTDVGWLSKIGPPFVNVPDDLAISEHVVVLRPSIGRTSARLKRV